MKLWLIRRIHHGGRGEAGDDDSKQSDSERSRAFTSIHVLESSLRGHDLRLGLGLQFCEEGTELGLELRERCLGRCATL